MFLARAGEYEACGLFSVGHFGLIIFTAICVVVAYNLTKNSSKEKVFKIIRGLTVVVCLLEAFKIWLELRDNEITAVKEWVPLYYCSILIYAGVLASFCKGKLKRMGDVFLATGAIVGGVTSIVLPTTSLPTYPVFHFFSLHSFFFHGTMVYLTLLVNRTKYVELELKDCWYFATLLGVVCVAALIVNINFNSNLMFISKNFPNTPVEIIYNVTGPLFTPLMIVGQMFLPFLGVFGILKLIERFGKVKVSDEE